MMNTGPTKGLLPNAAFTTERGESKEELSFLMLFAGLLKQVE